MESISSGALIRLLDQHCNANPGAMIATDADGTLWSGDVGIDTFEHLMTARGVLADAAEALRGDALEAGLAPVGDVNDTALALFHACENGAWSEKRTYEMMAWAFAGWEVLRVGAFAREALQAANLADRLHRELIAVLSWATRAGILVRVVSASPLPVVQQAVAWTGLDPASVIAATPAMRDGCVLAHMGAPIPYGPGKVHALRDADPDCRIAAAFGDNVFDLEMLQISAIPIAVRPKTRLLERGGEVPGLRLLERA
ncbi:MAG TPA: HAD family hydrolase [Polyangiaceae bacterium]|nr:HAD family hydrolase [Polyangiaceae bacterium]